MRRQKSRSTLVPRTETFLTNLPWRCRGGCLVQVFAELEGAAPVAERARGRSGDLLVMAAGRQDGDRVDCSAGLDTDHCLASVGEGRGDGRYDRGVG